MLAHLTRARRSTPSTTCETDEGWAKTPPLPAARLRGVDGLLLRQCSPSRTRPSSIEDCVGWALETTAGQRWSPTTRRCPRPQADARRRWSARVPAPTGDPRRRRPHQPRSRRGDGSTRCAGAPPARRGGPPPVGRGPGAVNLRDRDFLDAVEPSTPGHAALDGGPRVGAACAVPLLADRPRPCAPRRGHRASSRLHPDLEIDWLAQHPVTAVLEGAASGSTRPARVLASESRTSTRVRRARPARLPGDPADGRDPRRQLHGLPRSRPRGAGYDLWIGDEAWDVDYFLHENPELKRPPTLADRLRRLAADARGRRARGLLTADYNAEMIEHVARYPRLRDRAVFVGDPDDIVPDPFGRVAADPRVDRGALRLRRLRHRVRPGRRRPEALRRARYGRTSGSASSPSAARASAAPAAPRRRGYPAACRARVAACGCWS